MTAPASNASAAHSADLALDAAAALRADLAAADAAASAAGAPTPADEQPAVASWLLLVTSLERAAQLAPRARSAHFRRARVLWDDTAATLGEPRYGTIAARLARWRSADPTLPLVKELLWAVEQPEAAGYTRLALAGYTALTRVVPRDDVRLGYVLAQSARALRTLGDLDTARDRYEAGAQLGSAHRDRWLHVRSAIGLGAAHQQVGNHPAAREIYNAVLDGPSPDARFTAAAHHGLVLAAIAAEDWDAALAHGWHLLRAGRRGVVPRNDALLLMAGVCRRTGRHRAALSAARAALCHCRLREDPLLAHKISADVCLDTGDRALALEHAAELRKLVHTGAGPFEDAKALFTLGQVEERWGTRGQALADIAHALDLATDHQFHELVFKLEAFQDRLRARTPEADPTTEARGMRDELNEDVTGLSRKSQRIVERLLALDAGAGLAIAG